MGSVQTAISVHSRTYMSIRHAMSAALFSRHAYELEREGEGNRRPLIHRAYVTGSIITCVAFLEASINELLADASDRHEPHLAGLDTNIVNLMSKMWERGVPRTARYSVLEKYEIALDLAGLERFERGQNPFQDAKLVTDLRNAMIHWEPEWMPTGSTAVELEESHKFEKSLRGKFALNPLTGVGNPFYPDKCLSHGCAQ